MMSTPLFRNYYNIFGLKTHASCSEVNRKGYSKIDLPIVTRFRRYLLLQYILMYTSGRNRCWIIALH